MWIDTIASPSLLECRVETACLAFDALKYICPLEVFAYRSHVVEFLTGLEQLSEFSIMSFQQLDCLWPFLTEAQMDSFQLVIPSTGAIIGPLDLKPF
jgi:hypothetical protein